MIDRENFDYIKNIVGIKKEYDITSLYDILTVIKNNPEKTPSILIDKAQSLSNLQKNYDGIIRSLNDNDFVNFYTLTIELINKDIDTTLLFNVLKAIKHLPELKKTICDSYSNNQVLAKKTLIKNLDQYITEDSNVAILGSWYASILLPLLHDKVNEIWPIDIDEQAIKIGKNMFFPNLENVFEDASVDTMIYIGGKNKIKNNIEVLSFVDKEPVFKHNVKQERFLQNEKNIFDIEVSEDIIPIMNKMKTKISYVEDIFNVIRGINPYDKYRGQSQEVIKSRAYHSS